MPRLWNPKLLETVAAAGRENPTALRRYVVEKLLQAGGQPVYHFSRQPFKLMDEGIGSHYYEQFKPAGLFTTDRPLDTYALSQIGERRGTLDDLEDITFFGRKAREQTPNSTIRPQRSSILRLILDPDVKQATVPERELRNTYREFRRYDPKAEVMGPSEAVNYLMKNEFGDPDVLDIVNVDDVPGLHERIIRNPRKTSAFYGNIAADSMDKYDPERQLGDIEDVAGNSRKCAKYLTAILGLTGLATVTSEDEAEASKLTPVVRFTAELADKLMSKAAQHWDAWKLQDVVLNVPTAEGRRAMTVVDVLREPKVKTKHVILEDDKGDQYVLTLKDDFFQALMAANGARRYIERMAGQTPAENAQQAVKGVLRREAAMENSGLRMKDVDAIEAMQRDRLRQIDPNLVQDYVWFKTASDRSPIYLPAAYAETLKEMGIGRILKRVKE